MKILGALISIVTISSLGMAQNISFSLADPQPTLQETYGGYLLSGDLDGDGDIDLIQDGIGTDPEVFLNDGSGMFTSNRQFGGYFTSEIIALGDLDDDDDLDLVIVAANQSFVYWNDGDGNYSDDGWGFQFADQGGIQIGDVNGDSINDVLQYGVTSVGKDDNPFMIIWMNNGNGGFIRNDLGNLRELNTMAFIDLEGDHDLDIVSFGRSTLSNADSIIVYENDGNGQFSIFENSGISAFRAYALSVGDIDNDNDDDLLITGQQNGVSTTSLYINDGSGHFNELLNTPFPNVFSSSTALADFDNDNDLDVLIIGAVGGVPEFSFIYENLGNNLFEVADSIKGEYIPTNAVADFNGDDKLDIITQGIVNKTNVYWNETQVITRVEEEYTSALSLFPNPSANGVFRLSESRGWKVYSLNGIELNSDMSSVVDLSREVDGVYLLQVDGEVYKLLIKE